MECLILEALATDRIRFVPRKKHCDAAPLIYGLDPVGSATEPAASALRLSFLAEPRIVAAQSISKFFVRCSD